MKRAISLAAAVVLLAGCGSDGDDGEPGVEPDADTRTATNAPTTKARLFRSDAIAFTFEYPADFETERKPRKPVLAQVSLDPGAPFNAIMVRRAAGRELGRARYLDEFQRDFEKAFGNVEKREERIGDLDAGVLEFADSVERKGETVEFTSWSYFFTGAGSTWQVECVADAEHREQIEDACRAALESVEFEDGRKEQRVRPPAEQVD